MQNQRIKLAEAMGWKQSDAKNWIGEDPGLIWVSPTGREQTIPPDPENDANDCEALIDWLANYEPLKPRVTVSFGRGVRFDFYHGTHAEIEKDNWKQGVCELALKVIE